MTPEGPDRNKQMRGETMHTEKYQMDVEREKPHTYTNLWICRLISSWEGMDNKPLSSLLVITLWAQPIAVARSSQTLFLTLSFPLAQVVGGEKAVTSKDEVEEEGAIWTSGRAAASLPLLGIGSQIG